MEFLFVKLVSGRRVKDPATQKVLDENQVYRVKPGQFWFRRVEAGDVVFVDQKKSLVVESESKKDSKKKK